MGCRIKKDFSRVVWSFGHDIVSFFDKQIMGKKTHPFLLTEHHPGEQMRVLLSGDSFPPKLDGVQNFARNTIQALVRDGHKVHVFCSNGSPSTHLAPENYGATVTRGPGVEVQPKHKMLALKMDAVVLLFFFLVFVYLFWFCPYGCPFWLETCWGPQWLFSTASKAG